MVTKDSTARAVPTHEERISALENLAEMLGQAAPQAAPSADPAQQIKAAEEQLAEGLRKLSMLQLANLPAKRGDVKGYVVTGCTYTGAAAAAGVVDHVVEKYVIGNDTSLAEKLLQKIFG
jgi:hypothetical protein